MEMSPVPHCPSCGLAKRIGDRVYQAFKTMELLEYIGNLSERLTFLTVAGTQHRVLLHVQRAPVSDAAMQMVRERAAVRASASG